MTRSGRTELLFALVLLSAPSISAQAPGVLQATAASASIGDVAIAQLRSEAAKMEPGPERDYVAGVLSAREGRDEKAIRLFTHALPSLRRTEPDQAALAMRLLADVYDREGLYGSSAPLYNDLKHSGLMNRLPESYLPGAHDDAELARILANSPAQTLTWNGTVHLVTSRDNPLGVITTELNINGVRSVWILDTGANESVISQSLASQMHLPTLPGVAHISAGITGFENPLKVALLPSLTLGGATAHNVVLMVLDDATLTLSDGDGHSFHIEGVIGFPVLRALGRITFHHDGTFDATAGGGSAVEGSPMELRLLNPVVEAIIEGQPLPFTLDTGASGTNLSVRFYQRFKAEKAEWKRAETKSFGAGGETTSHTFLVPSLALSVGGRSLILHNISVFRTVQHADIDALFGNLGEDLLQYVQDFTLDFPHMRFVMGAPLPVSAHASVKK